MPSYLRKHLRFRPPDLRPSRATGVAAAFAAAALALTTVLAAALKGPLTIADPSIVYLLPVVAVGSLFGSWPAVATSIAAFLTYDFFFTRPLYTFAIAAPQEWLDLILFFVVAVAIGRLTALQLARTREAEFRTAEARAMFALSRDVATAGSVVDAAPRLVERLARQAEMSRVWLALGGSLPEERTIADTEPGAPRPATANRWVLQATTAEGQPHWARVRETGLAVRREVEEFVVLRVPVLASGETVGSIWATRSRTDPFPGRSHSRLMAAAADQIGQAAVRDRLAAEATAAEIAHQSDALKSALLDSVSHDLRTPLASIRVAAGSLMDPAVEWSPDRMRAVARSIDVEAERLSRLVHNLLDMSRIQAGALQPTLELYDLRDLLEPVVEPLRRLVAPSEIGVEIPDGLPAVRVDAPFVGQILANLIENAGRYAGGSPIAVTARALGDDCVEVVVEDGGRGVPPAALPRLFERFYRVPDSRRGPIDAGPGMGVGLAVVRGLAEAMGAEVEARQASLGGLAIAVRLQAERVEAAAGEVREPARSGAPADGPFDRTGALPDEPSGGLDATARVPPDRPDAPAEPAGEGSA